MEEVFRALSDAHRRTLLDALRDRNGQALAELEKALPAMTRFGVMKHLRVLEAAGLVTTRRDGRRKLHYLNPVPIQLLADRWISRYARPWTTGLADLKHALEAPPMSAPKHVFEIYIKATPERIWQALTDSELVSQYYFGSVIDSDFRPGSPIVYKQPDTGRIDIEGQILEADPPRRLVHTFVVRWDPDLNDAPTRVAFDITPMGDACLLSVTHDGFESETETYRSVGAGWPLILSGLKTLLETGERLEVESPEPADMAESPA
jgi:uncharacterized protein YndB with AHSA1/START domain/DNA-binding transcriptional ArsR family regulator